MTSTRISTPATALAAAILSLCLIAPCGCSPAQDDASSSSASQASESSSSISSEANKNASFDDIPKNSVITAVELGEMLDSANPPMVVDIRAPGVYSGAFIEGPKNIPAGRQFDIRIDEIPHDKTVVLISGGTLRIAEARATLLDADYSADSILVVEDGIEGWRSAGLPTSERQSLGC